MTEEEVEIAALLPLFDKGGLSAADKTRVEDALAKSEFLRRELDEVRSLSKFKRQILQTEHTPPSEAQIANIMAQIRQTPQNANPSVQRQTKENFFSSLGNLLFPKNPYQMKPLLVHAMCGLIAVQFIIAGGLFWQLSKSKKDDLRGQERLITRLTPTMTWVAFSKILNEQNLKLAATTQNNDLILTPSIKLTSRELQQIGKDFEEAGIAQFSIYSDGNYETKPMVCQNYKNDSIFENRPAIFDADISDKFSTIETIEGKIFGQTRMGPSQINLRNLGPDGGWFSMGSKSSNPAFKDNWKTIVGRFENDLNTELTRDNLPLVRVGLEILLGNDDGLYPGKFIQQDHKAPLNIKYPAQFYNLPGQAKITGFELRICGHSKK